MKLADGTEVFTKTVIKFSQASQSIVVSLSYPEKNMISNLIEINQSKKLHNGDGSVFEIEAGSGYTVLRVMIGIDSVMMTVLESERKAVSDILKS